MIRRQHACARWAGLVCACVSAGALAQTAPPPDAQASDPARLGWMVGSPPPADKIVRKEDGSFYRFPQLRWTFSNARQLGATTNVSRGLDSPSALPRAERADLDAVTFVPLGMTEPMTWGQAFDANYTDGVVVLHKGRIVYERYAGVFKPDGQHLAQSLTKSFFGTIAAMLVADGQIDQNALVTQYVPELKGSAFADATVRQVMDMTVGVRYSENYADPKAEIWDYARAGGMMPQGPGYTGPKTFYEFLTKLQKEGQHGQGFAYKTVNTEVLAWIIRRVTGQSLAEVLSERIWRKLGAENDAYFMVDRIGTESGGAGLNTTLHDLALFGEMMRNDGKFNGQQILPAAVVQDIRKGADKAHFAKGGYPLLPGWSYHNMWWVTHNPNGAYMARGIHGQNIYVDPKAEMVIVRYAAHPLATNAANDPLTLPAYQAVANSLMTP